MLSKPEEYAEAPKTAVADGYDCVKIDPAIVDEDGRRVHNLTGILPNKLSSTMKYFRNHPAWW